MDCKTCKSHCAWVGKEQSEHGKCLVGYTPITNADRIRAMTDEEMAEFIADDLIEPGYNTREKTVKMWLNWLKEEGET